MGDIFTFGRMEEQGFRYTTGSDQVCVHSILVRLVRSRGDLNDFFPSPFEAGQSLDSPKSSRCSSFSAFVQFLSPSDGLFCHCSVWLLARWMQSTRQRLRVEQIGEAQRLRSISCICRKSIGIHGTSPICSNNVMQYRCQCSYTRSGKRHVECVAYHKCGCPARVLECSRRVLSI
jgi:hypothetical protein